MPNQASLCLQKNKVKIMVLWEARAKKEVAAALEKKSLALQDSLPEYLLQLVDALSTTIDRTELRIQFDLQESERIGRKHGRERASSQDYTMDQMIFEYHILRQVIFDVIEEELVIAPVEREIIICSIEQAVNNAATQFSATLRDIQQHLTHTLAHDIRNPMTSARLGAEMIMRKPNLIENSKTAARIVSTMERVDLMIRDLLDASRLQVGETLPLQFEEFDLTSVTRQIATEFNYSCNDRISVKAEGTASGFWSKSGLSRVIENLTGNAIKYGSQDTPITITIKKSAAALKLSVHNMGPAIPYEEQSVLFQQYRRSKSTESKTGWGLGLSIVKGITEAHYGNVRIESSEGAGTNFLVELPLDARSASSSSPNFQ